MKSQPPLPSHLKDLNFKCLILRSAKNGSSLLLTLLEIEKFIPRFRERSQSFSDKALCFSYWKCESHLECYFLIFRLHGEAFEWELV